MADAYTSISKSGEGRSSSENRLAVVDPVWAQTREEASELAAAEPALASFLYSSVLHHERLESALSYHIAQKLGTDEINPMMIRQLFEDAFSSHPEIGDAIRADLVAVKERDPACRTFVEPLLYFKGFHALEAYRVAHSLWQDGRKSVAAYLQNRISERFAVDIHPAARLGRGILIDHATSVVIGETAVVEDDVSMLHEVTLGGSGKDIGDRHPKVRRGVLIGAGAKIIGNIEIGEYSRIGAGSVVLNPVPAQCTVAGVPAKIVGCAGCDQPARAMDHKIEYTLEDYSI